LLIFTDYLTDIAVAGGKADIGDGSRVADIDKI
jgi:hypothetical protein